MCLSHRILDEAKLGRDGEANFRKRNEYAVPINWRFTTQDIRWKLARLEPPF